MSLLDRFNVGSDQTGTISAHLSTRLRLPPYFWYNLAKRCLDLTVALILLIVLSLVFAVLAIAIKLDSRGPVIFKQTRVGKGGKVFTFFKFRSMRQDADPRLHEEHMRRLILGSDAGAPTSAASRSDASNRAGKLANDPRITRVGRILRKTSLDELPQLFNILAGSMSLVGPRPALPYEVRMYTEHERGRLAVVPGVTSLWALAGRGDVPFDEQIRLDLDYIERRSFWLDLAILARTPWAVLRGKGAG